METSDSQPSGVVPSQEIIKLIDGGRLVPTSGGKNIDWKAQVQPASIDLRLGNIAYRLQSSFLPQADTVKNKMKELVMYEVDLDKGGILERGAVYLIPLVESLNLEGLNISGKTNPKSSTGRLDVFTRVITDNSSRFEDIAENYSGNLYLEVVPRSFTIKIKSGQRLNQLRLFNSSSQTFSEDSLSNLFKSEQLLCDSSGKILDSNTRVSGDGLLMSVDLQSGAGDPIGYKTKKNSQVIELDEVGLYNADDFWEPIYPPKNGRLILEPEEFYIFASKERIRVPRSCAAEMVEFDAGSGELRTHYAGFFDPGFGYGKSGEIRGTKAV
ncbi:Deoxycytidine triphosphate deaminase, partial [hydrothermal vent metagenome]